MSAPLLPPTSVLRDAPGVSAAKFVPVFGSDWITSIVITFCCVTFCVSTIGDCPETVIVSSSEPTLEIGVDRRGETGRQLDAVAFEGAEPGQRERHRV